MMSKIKDTLLLCSFLGFNFSYADCHKDYGTAPFSKEDFPWTYLPEAHSVERESSCGNSTTYREAMEKLEESVTAVALHNTHVNNYVRNLNELVFEFLKLAVTYRLNEEREPLTYKRVDEEINRVLVKHFGNGPPDFIGNVGLDAEKIREVFREGNIRERGYLNWGAFNIAMFDDILDCKHLENVGHVDTLTGFNPSLKTHFADAFKRKCAGQKLFERGRFAASSTVALFRNVRSDEEKKRLRSEHTFAAITLDPPLSKREKAFLKLKGEYVPYQTGRTELQQNGSSENNPAPLKDPDNLYYRTADRFGFKTMVSMSGTIDFWLTLACLVGMDSQEDLENLRVAAIGFLVTYQHHTLYEVLVGSKSFPQLNIDLNSDYYKHLYTKHNERFVSLVEQEYKRRNPGRYLPSQIYRECLTKNADSPK